MDEFMMEPLMSDDIEPGRLVPAEFPPEPREAAAEPFTPELEPGRHELEAVLDVPVKVQAVLGRARMEIGELMRLRPGDVVELDRRVGQPVDIFVNNRLIARGEVVLIEGLLGVTLTEIVRQDR
jgi:flagellar motor switch protein FliN